MTRRDQDLITTQEAEKLKDDLKTFYGIRDANRFCSYVLDRTVHVGQLTRAQEREIRKEARDAYAKEEAAKPPAHLSNAEMIAYGKFLLR